MGVLGWVAVGVGVVVVVAVAAWLVLLATSFRVEPGTVVLLLKQGRATGRVLGPGRHFIQPWRKVLVQVYPARQLALVAGGTASADQRVDHLDVALRAHLADKTFASLSYTVRCRLDPGKVQFVHNTFGPEGIWPALRDTSRRCLIAEAAKASIEDVYGDEFMALERRFEQALEAALAEIGFELEGFTLREIDLGDTGEIIQATLRANLELELEVALARVRQAQLDNDATMAQHLVGLDSDILLRYRQLESWRTIVRRADAGPMVPATLAAMLVAGARGDGAGLGGLHGAETGSPVDEAP